MPVLAGGASEAHRVVQKDGGFRMTVIGAHDWVELPPRERRSRLRFGIA
jgi:hypothetical protein